MKTIKEILENYKEYKTFIEDLFGNRLCLFLTIEQMEQIGFEYEDQKQASMHKPKEWNEKNILAQLKKDVQFGWHLACNERRVSSSLMHKVVRTWCKVLENEFKDYKEYKLKLYGKPLFNAVAKKYGWKLKEQQNER